MIAAGKLNKRITIEQSAAGSPSQDAYGEPSVSWITFKEVWAEIGPIQGREFWARQQVQSEVTVRVRIRYLQGVTSAMRVVYGTRILSIENVIDPREGHEELQLMCSEGVKDE